MDLLPAHQIPVLSDPGFPFPNDCLPVNGVEIAAICSGLIDSGYTDWHRDASSAEQAPLSGMQQDLMENAPGYVQWNIALYEDGVFWILPGATNSRAPRPSANSSCSIRDRHSRAISAASCCCGTRRVIHETRSRTDADDAGEMFGPYLAA